MKFLRFATFLLVPLFASTPSTRGAMINLSYSGADEDTSAVRSVGSGSFSFADGSTSLTLANLNSFQFSQRTTITDPQIFGAATFSYGLNDLLSFSATLSAVGKLTALSFKTGYVDPSNSTFTPENSLAPEYFIVRSLQRNGASTFNGDQLYDELQTGTVVTSTAVPEPSSLALFGIAGGVNLVLGRTRRRQSLLWFNKLDLRSITRSIANQN